MLERAAELSGQDLSSFVVSASHEKALETLGEAPFRQLSAAGQRRLAEALLAPPDASPRLVQAARRYRRLIETAELDA